MDETYVRAKIRYARKSYLAAYKQQRRRSTYVSAQSDHFLNSAKDTPYKVDLKILLQQGISESVLYGDLVYKFKKNQ